MSAWFVRALLAAWLLCAGCLPAAASADDALDGIRARLAQPAVLRGAFEQEKQLQGFRNPLRSRGTFLLVRDRGIAWDTREPFASSAVLGRERLVTTLPDGTARVLLDATESPATAAVNALLLALVAGDIDALSPRFALIGTLADEGGWTLRLTPRPGPLARVFTTIDLAGDAHVREVRIVEAAGDRTTIRFDALVDAPPADAAELARFD